MRVFKPTDIITPTGRNSVFLAGSIENGTAEMWQDRVADLLQNELGAIYNPRRDDWDWTWKQSIHNAQFLHQVVWELEMQEAAQYIIFYFDPNTKSAISLLELGIAAGKYPDKCIVVCNEPFYKKGNVDIVCEHFGIKQVNSLEEAVEELKKCFVESSVG